MINKENETEFVEYFTSHSRTETAQQFNVSTSCVDTHARKLELPRKFQKYKDLPADFQFTPYQMEIITGSLLGDGGLIRNDKHRKISAFTEGHAGKQKPLLDWKKEQLHPLPCTIREFTTVGRKSENGRIIADPTKTLFGCNLTSISHPLFNEIEKKWYLRDENNNYILKDNRRIKIVPHDLVLTPNIIAVWYFDDGSNSAKSRQAVFNTQSFTKLECDTLADKLRAFGFTCGVVKNRHQFVIQINASSYLDFIAMMAERLPCECLRYKIDLSKYTPPDFSTRIQPKISEEQVKEIIELCQDGTSSIVISQKLEINKGTIDNIRYGRTWKKLTGGQRASCTKTDHRKPFTYTYRMPSKKPKNEFGITGGIRLKKNKNYYETTITISGKRINLGSYSCFNDAVAVRKEAEQIKETGVVDPTSYTQLKEKWMELKQPSIRKIAKKRKQTELGISGGVRFHKNKYEASIWINKQISLGSYKSMSDAIAVRKKAEQMRDNGVIDIDTYKQLKIR